MMHKERDVRSVCGVLWRATGATSQMPMTSRRALLALSSVQPYFGVELVERSR